jgi:integrase
VNWVRKVILFHGKKHPKDIDEKEISAFLAHLAVNRNVAASTQNQAFNALLFLYRNVLGIEFGELKDVQRARKPRKLPVVFTKDEIRQIITQLEGYKWIMGCIVAKKRILHPGFGPWPHRL